MFSKRTIWGSVTTLGFLLLITLGVRAAEMPAETSVPTSQFRRQEQPLGLKVGVTFGGLALIGLELWWFVLSKAQAQHAQRRQGVQKLTITVDGGYESEVSDLSSYNR